MRCGETLDEKLTKEIQPSCSDHTSYEFHYGSEDV